MLLGGMFGGWQLSRRFGRRRLAAALLLAVPPAACLWVAHRFWLVGAPDALVHGGLLGLGLCVGYVAGRPRRAGVALVIVSTGVSLVGGEAAVRRFVQPPPALPPPRFARLMLPSRDQAPSGEAHRAIGRPSETACHAIYGDAWPTNPQLAYPTQFPHAISRRPGVHRIVLHVGDSMVYGASVDRGEAFPEQLAQQEPEVEHINAGVPGVGPDAYYAVTQGWLRVMTPDVVVFHLFVGNDLRDLGTPYTCCASGALLAYPRGHAPTLRCPQPRALDRSVAPFRHYVESSPAPYVLRTTGSVSMLSAHLADAITRHTTRTMPTPGDADRQLGAILRALRDELAARRSRLVVSILPLRSALAGNSPEAAAGRNDHQRMRRTAEALDVPIVDSWDLFADAVRRTGDDAWFVPRQPSDPHFSPAGNRLLADWLHRQPALHAP